MSENLPYEKMWDMLKNHMIEIMNIFIKYCRDEKEWNYVIEALGYIEDEPTWDKHNSFGFMYGVIYCLNKLTHIKEEAEIEKREKDKDITDEYEDFIATLNRLKREKLEE